MIWHLEEYAGNVAVLDDAGVSLTYGELAVASDAVASAIGGRCSAFCLCRNEIGAIVGYVGLMNNGVVPTMLSGNLDEGLLTNLLNAYKPAFIWAPKDWCDRLPQMTVLYEDYGFVLLDTGFGHEYTLYEKLALLLTTSGSTGSPKLVRQSYENVIDNAWAIVRYLELNESERPITTLPMNYTYGLSIINSHLLVGATILVTDKTLMQKEFWAFFQDAGATSFGGVPYTYEMLNKLRFFRMDLPSLRTMTQAGGKILPELHEKFAQYAQDTGKKFIVMYGQCEATARMGYLPSDMAIKKKGSMGIAIPGGEFRLIAGDGSLITKPFETGELVYEGRNVTLGYAECGEDLALGDERRGVLETGDIAQFDEDGYFYIVGRKKRFLKVYGNRVNLDEVERLVREEFGVECACGGEDDYLRIFLTDQSLTDDVVAFAAAKTGLNSKAFKAIVIDSIPKNDSGKTLYKELSKYYGG